MNFELSEFVLTHTKGRNALDWEYFADVTVTTKKFWRKKTERRKIHREYTGLWHFVDTGEWAGPRARELEHAWRAQETLRELEAAR